MKKREKLKLINNYVEIYKCIYDCKQAILYTKNDSCNISNLCDLCDSIIQLKSLYEKTFNEKNMMDDSFILLKMQLENALQHPPQLQTKIYSFEFLLNKKKLLELAIKNII